MITPKMSDATEILDFKEDHTYLHQTIAGQEDTSFYYGTYELVPAEEGLTEIILYPSDEQPIFEPETHLYLQTNYLARVESDELYFLDKPGKSEEFEFKRIH